MDFRIHSGKNRALTGVLKYPALISLLNHKIGPTQNIRNVESLWSFYKVKPYTNQIYIAQDIVQIIGLKNRAKYTQNCN